MHSSPPPSTPVSDCGMCKKPPRTPTCEPSCATTAPRYHWIATPLIPLAPRTTAPLDLAIGERVDGPIFRRADGRRMDRHAAGRIVRRVARRAELDKKISPQH